MVVYQISPFTNSTSKTYTLNSRISSSIDSPPINDIAMTHFNNLSEAVNAMRARGFVNTFSIQHQCVYCSELSRVVSPSQLTLLEKHVVPSSSVYSGQEEVYGFRTDDDKLGIMTNIYAEYDAEGFYSVFRQCRQAG